MAPPGLGKQAADGGVNEDDVLRNLRTLPLRLTEIRSGLDTSRRPWLRTNVAEL